MKMKGKLLLLPLVWAVLFMVCTAGPVGAQDAKATENKIVKACVIGGMTMTGLWDEIAARFQAKTGFQAEVLITGPRPKISVPFRQGKADLLVMHSGDITTDLAVEGYGINMRACAQNDLVILGPPSDPAGIRGMKDGAAAFKKIYTTQANFLDGMGVGKREVCQKIWKAARLRPVGKWVIKDESARNKEMLKFAAGKNAYMVFGRMPVLFGKVDAGGLEIMVEGDPAMRRPYVVMEANPKRFPHVNHNGAKALSDFMLSAEIQTFMAEFGKKESGLPWFYPVWPHGV